MRGPNLVNREQRAMRRNSHVVYRVLYKMLRLERPTGYLQIHLTPDDFLRLATFQVWAVRHKVRLTFVLTEVLAFWREKTKKLGKTRLLGASVAALVSRTSEEVLKQAIARTYPNGEHIEIYKTEQAIRLSGIDSNNTRSPLVNADSPTESCIIYSKRIESRKTALRESPVRVRRTWRGNPWR